MRNFGLSQRPARVGAVPRGIETTGPAVLSYGFRPFFLLAGTFAVIDMVLWIAALTGLVELGGMMGPIDWHAHEMLFGYGTAALCGFILTAVPNWTGRLPFSGRPLLGLVMLWLVGRLVMLAPQLLGEIPSAALDALFLPTLSYVVAREVVAGRNWQNLRVVAGIGSIALLNLAFHISVLALWDEMIVLRATVAVFVLLITQVGGRVIPSFTRNYLAKTDSSRLPRQHGRLDEWALAVTAIAVVAWAVTPYGWPTAGLAMLAAVLQGWRLSGWRGLVTVGEPLLLILHVGYGFVALGLAGIAAAALGLLAQPSALHLLTAGSIGIMTLAMMTRASRGHTGRPLAATRRTTTAYLLLVSAAVARPAAEMLPALYHVFLDLSGGAWVGAFTLFVVEYAPMLLAHSLAKRPRQ